MQTPFFKERFLNVIENIFIWQIRDQKAKFIHDFKSIQSYQTRVESEIDPSEFALIELSPLIQREL